MKPGQQIEEISRQNLAWQAATFALKNKFYL
jgi:hypothetical protein